MGNFAGDEKILLWHERQRPRSDHAGPGAGESCRAGHSSSGAGVGDAFRFLQQDPARPMRLLRTPAARSI